MKNKQCPHCNKDISESIEQSRVYERRNISGLKIQEYDEMELEMAEGNLYYERIGENRIIKEINKKVEELLNNQDK